MRGLGSNPGGTTKSKQKVIVMTYKTYEVHVYDDGTKFWYQNGKLHREDGPAAEYSDGTKKWFKDGKLHREDGPAIEYTNGTKMWLQNGFFHREDGPAIEYGDGRKMWFKYGKLYFVTDFMNNTNPPTELTVAEIEALLGYPIKVIKG